jgi:hypothetical protein
VRDQGSWAVKALIAGAIAIVQHGCALHYYDADSQVEHLWGIGHMRMKAAPPQEGLRCVVKGVEVVGVVIEAGEAKYGTSVGWNRQSTLSILDEDASVRLEWPDSDLFNVRVGSKPPFSGDAARAAPPTVQMKER